MSERIEPDLDRLFAPMPATQLLATDIELTGWCPVHVVVLEGQPRLTEDRARGTWFLVLGEMRCSKATTQTECIGKWIVDVQLNTISPADARARAKIG